MAGTGLPPFHPMGAMGKRDRFVDKFVRLPADASASETRLVVFGFHGTHFASVGAARNGRFVARGWAPRRRPN